MPTELDAGVFTTTSVRPWHNPEHSTSGILSFDGGSNKSPTVILGYHQIDVKNVRIRHSVDNITDNSAHVTLQTWADTTHYSSGVAGLRIPDNDPDFQCGHFNTTEDHSWQHPIPQTTRRINFSRPYAAPPKVVVWLNSVDTGGEVCRVRAYASGITPSGFTVHLETWSSTKLWSAGATWFAHSADRSDIRSGTFSIGEFRTWETPWLKNIGRVSFEGFPFDHPPRVFTALNELDVSNNTNVRVVLYIDAEQLTSTGMDWHIDSWADTKLYGAGAAYVAFV
ncbi:hypothetical protein PHLGIDRAFT_61455 [Phlebiopsis gigantea 11061_1 CR5-6]|uniref:H-type lectin domain-containing protein n=1 Tax=Phlebiopsis gigantea (strain 11061_1 CR5-6) TaxID=745531 RepID=A0A0C3SED1_PHLG1|nr:hypothetical protein PHLGIDRAFT_61455 [Phlebiopsis gigantea 11061_1 CR5-6]